MTERNMGENFSWFIAEVVSVKDKLEAGRVQIRVFGRHDDKTNIPDDDLPWAMVMQPVTSAAHGRMGSTPVGLIKGSKVIGFWTDEDHQNAIIMGSFAKVGDVKGETSVGNVPDIDTSVNGVPSPSQGSTQYPYNATSSLFKQRLLIAEIDAGLKLVNSIKNNFGSTTTKDVEQKMKEPKSPTTASVDKTDTGDVLDHIKQVDPNGVSSTLPNMANGFSNIKNIMNLSSPMGLIGSLTKSITGAVSSLSSSLGFNQLSSALNSALNSGLLQSAAKIALTAALIELHTSAAKNNGVPKPITRPLYAVATATSPKPDPSLIVATPPALYIQQYYSIDKDPFPGYIQWLGPSAPGGNPNYKYTLRGTQPNYTSPLMHVQYHHADDLALKIGLAVAAGALTAKVLDGLLSGSLSSIKDMGLSKVLGAGVTAASIVGLSQKLIPNLGKGINGLTGKHLPNSVLGAGVGVAMGAFAVKQALLAVKKASMNSSLAPTQDQQDANLKAAMKASEEAAKVTG
jgi:Gp5 N-terminal OB domain